ncbi:short-chain dehydrogenase/reductase [Ligilactobacillus aviarius]|uniref:oxidoreductase n=1 Tax=Ligilactobacillus aviarius TaxID=1606 RepID=UPI0007D8F4A3|nr:oxidoreductase [Ligilactobacillus aviarius]OAQ03681.1 short-chain dehydrogenase/reductase [Ligilactobacillus aviarius]OAQ05660.1 short-chain dehydrogenase/reductase [Ligilactobacillus aviarius]OAS79271.1 short-chain dehydrogenase/reductase [Ligilactobacillus aviarius]PEG71244.1 oxidoreductase [Ligilactobacillus aviarius]PEG74516.1 oxidoreductase [Ligilactobacillus aviarius]
MAKVILVTGATDGIGRQAAIMLAKQGYTIYGGGRNPQKLEALRDEGIIPVKLDLTQNATLIDAVQMILNKENRIDALVNCAGYGSYGAIENVTMKEVRRQFDVNLFGLAELVKLILPQMRKQHSGRIINVSSMGGRLTTYFGAWYHATKYALEAFSDALRMETHQFGIDVSIIEPGGIKTNWGMIAADHLQESSRGTVYEQEADRTAKMMKAEYSSNLLSNPKVIAKAISKAVNSRHPKARYLIGFGAKPLVFMHSIMPTKVFDWLMRKIG